MSPGDRGWWHDAVGYEVYLRSLADSDGDGVGDLRGLIDKLEYLAWLGVSLVWVTPFYPSPMHDHGYDVADYTGVADIFGTLADVDELIACAHRLGLRLVIDLVPNHSSSEHPWFRQARSSRDNPYRDYYVWRDPAPDGGPPNNWVSHFGGPAWTLDEASGQYWCHLFLPEQPDLNWANPAVADEFDAILRFWLDRGVDGFRIDVAHALAKHPDMPDLPVLDDPEQVRRAPGGPAYGAFQHIYDLNQPEVFDVYRRWRKVAEPYGALLIGEVYVLEADTLAGYLRHDDGLHLGFWFGPLHLDWEPASLRAALAAGAAISPAHVAWVQGSHDRSRAPSRFGGGRIGKARSLALATLLMGLPGTPFVYQGEEIGLTDAAVGAADAQDPIGARGHDYERSRDVCRTPMLWAPTPGYGFTSADRPWLPFGDRRETETVAVQRDDPASHLGRYRALIAVRRHRDDLRGELAVQWLTGDGPIIAYRRGDTLVAANCGGRDEAVDLPTGSWRVGFCTDAGRVGKPAGERFRLVPAEAVVLLC